MVGAVPDDRVPRAPARFPPRAPCVTSKCASLATRTLPQGAKPDEAISWGKVRIDSNPVKVYAEATIIMPLLVAQTFARER